MSNEERPIPIPRPRQSKAFSDETDSTSRAYENYAIKQTANASLYDALNAQLNDLKVEMQRPQPRPRGIKPAQNYENTTLNNCESPQQSYQQPDLPPKTGAIRKAPNIPKLENKLENDEDKESPEVESNKEDVMSLSLSTSGKSNSEKYVTPSPT